MEIIYFESGTFEYDCDSKDYVVSAPALAFVESGVLHSLSLCQGQRESALVFDCKMLSYELFDHSQSEIIEPLLQHQLTLPALLHPEDPM